MAVGPLPRHASQTCYSCHASHRGVPLCPQAPQDEFAAGGSAFEIAVASSMSMHQPGHGQPRAGEDLRSFVPWSVSEKSLVRSRAISGRGDRIVRPTGRSPLHIRFLPRMLHGQSAQCRCENDRPSPAPKQKVAYHQTKFVHQESHASSFLLLYCKASRTISSSHELIIISDLQLLVPALCFRIGMRNFIPKQCSGKGAGFEKVSFADTEQLPVEPQPKPPVDISTTAQASCTVNTQDLKPSCTADTQ